MKKNLTLVFSALATSVALYQTPVLAQTAATEKVNLPKAITGEMTIDYGTRKSTNPDSSPAIGAKDTYKLNLSVAETTQFEGTIVRLPNLQKWGGYGKAQEGGMQYDINVFVINPAVAGKPEFDPNNPKHRRAVGKLVGKITLDANGKYDPSNVRLAVNQVGSASAFESKSRGYYFGKGAGGDKLADAALTFVRTIGNKPVTLKVKEADPLRFEGLTLPAGPAAVYTESTVNGNFIYDYETGNYLTKDVMILSAGSNNPDKITGSVKYSEDPNRLSNGISFYEFNLRYNEETNKPKSTEAAAFAPAAEEDAFFAVDNTVPCITGRMNYVDTNFKDIKDPSSKETKKMPTESRVRFALESFQLTKMQVMQFHKLLLFIVGPFNDE